jgi:hypothetical protein
VLAIAEQRTTVSNVVKLARAQHEISSAVISASLLFLPVSLYFAHDQLAEKSHQRCDQ